MKVLMVSLQVGVIVAITLLHRGSLTPIFQEIRIIHIAGSTSAGNENIENLWISEIVSETKNPEVAKKICEVFGKEKCKEAIMVATCESQMDSGRIGDRDLIYWDGDELVGMSVGVFQIRRFRDRPSIESLKNYNKNIEVAYDIYKRQGWNPWLNCKRKLGL